MNKGTNIFWIIIDSVRTFRTGADDRDRIDIIDEFANESIEFTNCVTSAPSSKLAAGAMFTGMPSVYVARHFNDWKFKNDKIKTIKTLVDEHDYKSFPLIDTRNGRENYQHILPPVRKKDLPRGYNLSDYVWSNEELFNVFEHIINGYGDDNPVSFVLWYDCRRDPKTNYYISKTLRTIKEQGYWDNSIIIMQSDHGYPDPRSKLNENYLAGLGHDMILTDDNIKTPMLIRYPQGPVGKKISRIIGHVDIIPTIFDILKIQNSYDSNRFFGKSVLPLIVDETKPQKRIIRTDTRLTMDVGKITSLRGDNYKYTYFYDDAAEVLVNLIADPNELVNLLDSKYGEDISKVLSDFRNELKSYDKDIFNFHLSGLKENTKNNFQSLSETYSNSSPSICIVSKATHNLIEILIESIVSSFQKIGKITLLGYGGINYSSNTHGQIINVSALSKTSITQANISAHEIVIYLTENSKRVFLKPDIYSGVKAIKGEKLILLNYNFELFDYFRSRWFPSGARLFFSFDRKGYIYKDEPLTFVKDVFEFIGISFNYLTRRGMKKDLVAAREIHEYRTNMMKKESGNSEEVNREIKNMSKATDD